MTEQNDIFNINAFIEETLIWMDFEKIHSVMKHLNWKWGGHSVPDIHEIKEMCVKEIRRGYEYFIKKELTMLNSGTAGFDVSWWREDEDSQSITCVVRFVVTDWNNYL